MLHREYPLRLYLPLFALIEIICLLTSIPVIHTYLETGLVPRFPTLIILATVALVGVGSLAMGLILKEITNSRYENRYLRYLDVKNS